MILAGSTSARNAELAGGYTTRDGSAPVLWAAVKRRRIRKWAGRIHCRPIFVSQLRPNLYDPIETETSRFRMPVCGPLAFLNFAFSVDTKASGVFGVFLEVRSYTSP